MAVEMEQAYKQKNAVKLLKIISEDCNQQIQNWAGVDYSKLRKQLNSHQELPKTRNTFIPSTEKQPKLSTIFRKRSHKKSTLPYQICPDYCKQYKSFTFTNEENSSQNYQSQKKKQKRQRKILKAATCSKLHAEDTISKISVGQDVSSQLRTTGSEQYILKVTKFSIPNKKQLNQCLNENENKQEIQIDGDLTGRLKQKYKNKIKKKISHKFMLRKYPTDRNSTESKLILEEDPNKKLSQRVSQKTEPERPFKINLLQNWLESNRYKKRKSVAWLLRELFDHKSQQKQINPVKKMTVQSHRLLSIGADLKMTNQ